MTALEYLSIPFNTVIKVRFAIKKKSTGENSIVSPKMEKNQYQEWFFDNSGNGCENSEPENRFICIWDRQFIPFSSKVIGLKST